MVSVPETVVLQLDGYASDPDISGYVTAYDLVRHWDQQSDGYDHFMVSGSGKELVIKQQLDFDHLFQLGRTYYLLNLTAMDNGYPSQRKAYLTLQINITDSDDQGPAFVYPDCPVIDHFCTTPLFEAVARKSFKGELKVWPGEVAAVDKDSINNTVLYYIVTVSPAEYSDHFKMDAASGKVFVVKEFDEQNIDAIHVTIKAVENSTSGQYLTTTLRVQVVGEYYASYRDSFRHVPLNERDGSAAHSASPSLGMHVTELPVSLFIGTVGVFFLIVISFPFILMRLVRGRQMGPSGETVGSSGSGAGGGGARVTSPQLTSKDNSDDSGSIRKESSDSTTTSILTCTSSGDQPSPEASSSVSAAALGPSTSAPPTITSGASSISKPASVSVTVHQAGGPKSGSEHSATGTNTISSVPNLSTVYTYRPHERFQHDSYHRRHHHHHRPELDSDCSSTASSSSASSFDSFSSPASSAQMDYDDGISLSPITRDSARRVSSVSLQPGDNSAVCTSFASGPHRPWNQTASQRLKRSFHKFFGLGSSGGGGPRDKRDRQKVRFDIRNVSNF